MSDAESRASRASVPRRAAEVLGYFVRHPDSTESLEGMVRWRLTKESIYRSTTEIDEALSWLVAEGLLIRSQALGTDPMFSIDPSKLGQAMDLLQDDTRDLHDP